MECTYCGKKLMRGIVRFSGISGETVYCRDCFLEEAVIPAIHRNGAEAQYIMDALDAEEMTAEELEEEQSGERPGEDYWKQCRDQEINIARWADAMLAGRRV